MDYINFFTKENKSGIKSKEGYLSKHYPELYQEIINYNTSDWYNVLPFKEKIWYFINLITNKVSCLNCNSEVKFKGNINKGYNKYCSLECANDSGDLINLAKDATIKKYGVDSTNKLESVKNTKKESYISRYGVDNPMKDIHIKNKHKESLLKNHGVDNPMKDINIKNLLVDNLKSKYGVNNVFKLEETKIKTKSKNLIN
ncbi:MAG: hypothetical protein ABFD07_20655, partial [Methanobacterium sp.]